MALLDDLTALTKVAASSLDDVGAQAAKAEARRRVLSLMTRR
jgi:predicted DNA repair protein MutK